MRARTALAAGLAVAVVLGAASVGLVWAVHRSLVDGLVTAATDEAVEVSGLAAMHRLPSELPAAARAQAGVAVQVVQTTGGRRRVVSASSEVAGRAPVSSVVPASGTWRVLRTPPVFGAEDDWDLTVATTVRGRQGHLTIYAITSVHEEESSVHLLIFLLAGLVPVLVAVAGVLGWELAGRALRPVEQIRSEVAEITSKDLHRRVPVPPLDDEIARLARTVNETLARLETGTERQRQFVSDASHELRSPLAALLAQVDVARARPASADWQAVSRAVMEEGARLSAIIDDLLLLARSDEGHLRPGRDAVDVDELVFAEGRRLRSQQRVTVDLRRVGAGRVTGDPGQLQRVVRNLADNAERHAATTVAFEVARHDGWVELAVVDDGPGIPRHQRRHVFERFARLDSARDRPSGGTGLGLAIVGDVVAAHGGTVEVADSAAGARFVVRLPAAPD